jgi:aryl-alcohol dehydrogenase-like predicted oxidoreductase
VGFVTLLRDAEQTRAVVQRALDEGITLFDTADAYGNRGGSEELLGKALGKRRHEVIVASKFGMSMGDGPYLHGASRRYVMAAAEDSLRRLNTDYIDLYQLHFPNPETPQEETLEALADLVHAGKVRYLGCSNFAAWQLAEALGISRARGLPAYISAQNQYNLLDRQIERELIPAWRHFGVGILPFFPLASGFLTGKYRRGAEQTRMPGIVGGGRGGRALTAFHRLRSGCFGSACLLLAGAASQFSRLSPVFQRE